MDLSNEAVALIGFVTLFVLMLLRVPVGMAMGLVESPASAISRVSRRR